MAKRSTGSILTRCTPVASRRTQKGSIRRIRRVPLSIPLRVRVLTRLHRLRRRVRDVTYGDPDGQTVREDAARRYLRGSGVEVGALHLPLRVPRTVTVRYVDRGR